MDTTLPSDTTTTSSDAVSLQMEACTETAAADPSWYKLGAVFLINLLVSYTLAVWMTSRPDGMVRIGWTAQTAELKGQQRRIVIPIYMDITDYRKMRDQ